MTDTWTVVRRRDGGYIEHTTTGELRGKYRLRRVAYARVAELNDRLAQKLIRKVLAPFIRAIR
jgi:hypothetical protein